MWMAISGGSVPLLGRKGVQMKRPASTNARPALSGIFFFLLAVIMFSISYAVSSLAATVQAATNTMSIARDPTSLPAPIGKRLPAIIRVTLTARELDGALCCFVAGCDCAGRNKHDE